MKKSEIIQLVKDATDNMFRDRTCAMHIGLSFEQLVGQVFATDPSQLDFYAKDFDVDVVDEKPFKYALLPKKIIQFKDMKKGVRNVSETLGTGLTFVPTTATGRRVFGDLTGGIDKTVGYEVKTDRIVFDNLTDGVTKVKMSLVCPFSEWDNDDDIPLPAGMSETLIQMAIASVQNKDVQTNIFKVAK